MAEHYVFCMTLEYSILYFCSFPSGNLHQKDYRSQNEKKQRKRFVQRSVCAIGNREIRKGTVISLCRV